IAGVIGFIYTALITSTSRLVGIKGEVRKDTAGLVVKELAHNSPAQKMGIKKKDVLLQVDGQAVNSTNDLDAILLKHLYDDKISFTLIRKSEDKQIHTNYQTKYSSRAMQIVMYGENFKWLLLGLIIISIGIFTLWLSSLNFSQSTKWFKRMQLISSAAF